SIKIAAVSYLNTKPFLYGLQQYKNDLNIEINSYEPHICAQQLMQNHAQIGLIPVAALPAIPQARIISNYCIGANKEVDSVLIVSKVPIKMVTHLYLDYQSRTSVLLAQILLKFFWQKEVILLAANPGYENEINHTTAGVIIGDRALRLKAQFEFVYDLAQAWHQYKKLPFMFAAWVSTLPVSNSFETKFNQACAAGLAAIPAINEALQKQANYYPNTLDYLSHKISYQRNAAKMEALKQFFELIKLLPVSA
ncbi:MAG TPA: menaquinone biosynthesis protein, partial [Bacteroidia bacterium]|nr:menaquinone biosynthesis protein [Bacteroidia bacterium]